jgi:translocation and assembly module TamB
VPIVRKLTLSAAVLVLVLAAVPASLLYYLAYTEAGLQFVVARLPERIGKVGLKVEGASGTIAGGLVLRRFELEHELVSLTVDDLRTRVAMLPLLWQSIAPQETRIASVRVVVHRRQTPPPKRTPRFLPAFLSVEIPSAEIERATLVAVNGTVLDFTELSAAGAVRPKTIRFYRAGARLADLRFDAIGLLTAADPLQVEGSSRVSYTPAGLPRWVANADLDGDLLALGVTGTLSTPFRADLRNGVLQALGEWNFTGEAHVHDFDLRAFGGGPVLGKVSGDLELALDKLGYRASGTLDSSGLGAGPFSVGFDGSFARKVLTARRIVLVHRSSGASVEAAGEIGIVPDGPRLELTGSWRDFRWPLAGDAPAVRSAGGRFRLGETWPYALQLEGPVEPVPLGLAPLPLKMTGRLAKNRLIVDAAEVQVFDGLARGGGYVSWAPAERWGFGGRVTGLDPRHVRPDLPGRLDFNFGAGGEGFAPGHLDLDVRELRGTLRDTAARGSGSLKLRGTTWSFARVDVVAGGVRALLDGSLGATERDFTFRLEASDLGVLAPQSRGQLRANGRLRGTAAEPVLALAASGRGLQHQGVTVGQLEADVDFDPRAGRSSRVDVVARGLEAVGRRLERVELKLDGQSEDHQLDVEVRAPELSLRATADGRFTRGAWAGTWDRLDLTVGEQVSLALDGTMAMQATVADGSVAGFCLRDGRRTDSPARLCAAGDWGAGGWQGQLDATQLPLAALTAGLTPRVRYEGTVDAAVRASAPSGGAIVGTLRAALSDALLRHRRVNGREDVVRLGSGDVEATAVPESISARLLLDAGATGRIEGSAVAQRSTGDVADMPLRASLAARTDAIGLLNLYVPEIDRSAGRLTLDLAFGGTVGTPLVSGLLKLEDGELDLYNINLALRATTLEARLIDNGFSFQGSARSGEGSLQARGNLALRAGQPSGTLELQGQDLLLVNVPEARITASPDLRFRIDGRDLEASGKVLVPFARIAPADLTGAVVASGDERIVGAPAVDPEDTFRVTSNIRLELGEKVEIDTFGLTGRLAGAINATTTPDGTSRGSGELGVAEGKYMALGRRLDIERGRLIFGGGLLADPGIDIRAVKVFPDVKAGVNVRGTLREQRMTFFAEPSLPQSQIVSLILAGGTLESAQNSNRSDAGRNALLAQGGAILAQQLGSRIGIEDVGIEQNLANETSLVLGKYLSPRLYVSYGISLAEAINTLQMRYTLNDKWTIRTESGREQRGEIVYTIERN